jgi:deoxyribodipyrimidine photolyase
MELRENNQFANFFSNLGDRGLEQAQNFAQRAVASPEAQRLVSDAINNFASEYATDLINAIVAALPSETELNSIADQLSEKVITLVNTKVLPEVYNTSQEKAIQAQTRQAPEKPFTIDDAYLKLMSNVPSRIPISFSNFIPTINVNPRSVLRRSLPPSKFKQIVERFQPLPQRIQSATEPVIVQKATDVGVLVVFTSALVGGLITFGYMKLYQSVD